MKNVVAILRERGLLEDMTDPHLERVVESPVTVYAGFDPTSDSLQVGNLVTIVALAHFQRCGHRVIALAGGATGMIGDPSGKDSERRLLSEEEVERNLAGIRENLARTLRFGDAASAPMLVNNNDWLKAFTFIAFLRDVGKHFRMGAMLGKDSVRTRLASEAGMSFAEFSYQLLQAYDFLQLYDTQGCVLQIGGSDQWGNITAGIELIRRLREVDAYGLTIPLICDSAGKKFGKSEGNAVYLSPGRTSYYDFYQFFVRSADADVGRLLRIFTFLPMEEIAVLEQAVRDAPERREAQKRLAEEVTRWVHGESGLEVARRASAVLFGESMEGLRADDLLSVFANVASTELARSAVEGQAVIDVAGAVGLCRSKAEVRRLVQSGGLYVNNRRVQDIQARLNAADIVDGRLVVLRSGKKSFHLVKIGSAPERR